MKNFCNFILQKHKRVYLDNPQDGETNLTVKYECFRHAESCNNIKTSLDGILGQKNFDPGLTLQSILSTIELSKQSTYKKNTTIYVSCLLRTWETAVLLHLTQDNRHIQLYVAPFLKEDLNYGFKRGNYPINIIQQIVMFTYFLKFMYRYGFMPVAYTTITLTIDKDSVEQFYVTFSIETNRIIVDLHLKNATHDTITTENLFNQELYVTQNGVSIHTMPFTPRASAGVRDPLKNNPLKSARIVNPGLYRNGIKEGAGAPFHGGSLQGNRYLHHNTYTTQSMRKCVYKKTQVKDTCSKKIGRGSDRRKNKSKKRSPLTTTKHRKMQFGGEIPYSYNDFKQKLDVYSKENIWSIHFDCTYKFTKENRYTNQYTITNIDLLPGLNINVDDRIIRDTMSCQPFCIDRVRRNWNGTIKTRYNSCQEQLIAKDIPMQSENT